MATLRVTLQLLSILLFGLGVTACQTGSSAPDSQPVAVAGATASQEVGEYKLGAADQLKITVFGEPTLSGEFIVDGEGRVSLPLVGEVSAAGKTLRDFQRDVQTRFADGFLRDPSISVDVLNFRPFYILGEVNKPGEYPYTNRLTVLNAIATAEGFTYRANKKYVLIKGARDPEEKRVELTPTTRINPGDTVQVLERLF